MGFIKSISTGTTVVCMHENRNADPSEKLQVQVEERKGGTVTNNMSTGDPEGIK